MSEDWEKQWERKWAQIPIWWMILWRAYQRLLRGIRLENPEIIELGSGSGRTTLALTKEYRGRPTLVDSSKAAMVVAKNLFKRENVRALFLCQDISSIDPDKKFDLVHSEGLIEHFSDTELDRMVKLHANLVKTSGYVIIFVPTPSTTYKIWRILQEMFGIWYYGEEKPLTSQQLVRLCQKNGLVPVRTTKTPFQTGILATKATKTLEEF